MTFRVTESRSRIRDYSLHKKHSYLLFSNEPDLTVAAHAIVEKQVLHAQASEKFYEITELMADCHVFVLAHFHYILYIY